MAGRPDLRLRGPVKIYAGYTRCDHCGIYDSDPRWCDLCGKPKDTRRIHESLQPAGAAGD